MKKLISFLMIILFLNSALIATFSIMNRSGVDRNVYFQCVGGICPAHMPLPGSGFGQGSGTELGYPDKATFWIKHNSGNLLIVG
jgi:hypothetical protein